jgi:hypothetical protein
MLVAVSLLCHIGCRQSDPGVTPAGDQNQLSALLPESGEIAGWARSSEPEFYGQEDLWEYINGQAEFYLDYGFQRVVALETSSEEDSQSLVVEIYRMSAPEEAFGIFAAERSRDDHVVDVGVQGYASSNVVGFWKGPYYVKLASFSAASGIEAALLEHARTIAAKIGGEYQEPPLFNVFPAENRVPTSERYVPSNLLGQSYLTGYRVDYQDGERRYQLFLVEHDSPEQAVDALDRYADFLQSKGRIVTRRGELIHRVVAAQGASASILFRRGAFMGGVVNIDDVVLGEEIVRDMVLRCDSLGE